MSDGRNITEAPHGGSFGEWVFWFFLYGFPKLCGIALALYAWGYAIAQFGFWGLIFGWIAAIPAFFIGGVLGPIFVYLFLLACVLGIFAALGWWLWNQIVR